MSGELWQSSCSVGKESLGSAEVQTLTQGNTPTGGTFTLSYNGQTTSTLAFNAPATGAGSVQVALRALPNVGGTLISCAGGPFNTTPITITFSGILLGPQSLIIGNGALLTGAGAQPTATVTRTTPGTSSIGVAVAATRKAYFNTDLKLSRERAPRPHAFMVGRRDNMLALTTGPVKAGGTASFPISSSEIIEPLLATIRGAVTPTSLAAGTASVQNLNQTNTPTGGTFALSYKGQTTTAIPFSATAATVGTALNLLTTITADGGVGVPTGGPFNTTQIVITFLRAANVPLITGDGTLLTGGGSQPTAVVTAGTPGVNSVNLWTFTPGPVLDPQTWQWYDGARAWNEVGVRGGHLKISGSVEQATTVTMTLAGTNLVAGPLTTGLADRVPDFSEGWECKLYIDALGGVPGTTNIPGTLLTWDVDIDNAVDYLYTADDTLAANAVLFGNLVCTAKFRLLAAPSTTLTEFTNWDNNGTANPVTRLVRLVFGNNTIISGAFPTFVTVDLPGSWSAVDLGQAQGQSRAYDFSYTYLYDPVNAYGLQIRCQSARAVAYV